MTPAVRLSEVIQSRRSVRSFRPEPVPPALLEELLALTVQAPSAHNSQPWRFVVLQGDKHKLKLAKAMGEQLRLQRLDDGDPHSAVNADVARSIKRISEAPLALLLCMVEEDLDSYPDDTRRQAERTMGVQSVALAAGHFLLAAEEAGLGACWICAPLFAPQASATSLDLPQGWEPQALILAGYPAESGAARDRKAMSEVVRWL